jgi:hypothetical protein
LQVQNPQQFNTEPELGLCRVKGKSSEGRTREDKITTPLDQYPVLFRVFASLDENNSDAILEFANRHGFLGKGEWHLIDPLPAGILLRVPEECHSEVIEYLTGQRAWKDVREPATRANREPFFWSPSFILSNYSGDSETYITWKHAILKMRNTIYLYDLVSKRDIDGLEEMLTCHCMEGWASSKRKGPVRAWFLPELVNPTNRKVTQQYLTGIGYTKQYTTTLVDLKPMYPENWGTHVGIAVGEPCRDEVIEVATKFVQKNVAGELYRRVHPKLVVDPDTENLVMKMHPDDLRAAMWHQFAQAITGNKQFRQCRACADWYEVMTDDNGRTARRLFCSEACKTRDHRRRKDKAVTLNAEGMSPEEIATRLNTDPDRIKKWVDKKRK